MNKQEEAQQFISSCAREATAVIEGVRTTLFDDRMDEIVNGADSWLRSMYCASVTLHMTALVSNIVERHGIEAAIGYLNLHRNETFGRQVIDVVSKTWKREALSVLIDGLNAIITPPTIEEPKDEQSASEAADSAAEG